MQLKRMFITSGVKGTRNYLDTQKRYEILRTAIYFGISAALFIAGYLQTIAQANKLGLEEVDGRANLLTLVAILGCLPACKSAVSAVMFLRFKSLLSQTADVIEEHSQGLSCLYDMVFTSYKKNYVVGHLTVCGGTVCGFAENKDFAENDFYKHINDILKLDGHKDVTVKVFTSLPKYTERLEQMKALEKDGAKTQAILDTLKSVAL